MTTITKLDLNKEQDIFGSMTKPEQEWTNVLATQEQSLVANEINAEIARIVIKLAKKKIADEKGKI